MEACIFAAACTAASGVGKSTITSSPIVFTTWPPVDSAAVRSRSMQRAMAFSATASPAVSISRVLPLTSAKRTVASLMFGLLACKVSNSRPGGEDKVGEAPRVARLAPFCRCAATAGMRKNRGLSPFFTAHMKKTFRRALGHAVLALGFLALFSGAGAFAAAVVQSVQGDVRAGPIGKPVAGVTLDQRLPSGTTVVTGPDAQVILRFDDGQRVVLNHSTHFRIVDFRYLEEDPTMDRSVFALLKGALRIVSGAIATRNRQAVALRTPQATIGIRGTDFMVALVNPAYISVLGGAVTATNAAGTVAFGAGSVGSVATSAALATAIPASALPAAASAAFSNLSAAAVVGAAGTAGGVSAGASEATGAATGMSTGTVLGVGAGAAAAAAAAASNRGSS